MHKFKVWDDKKKMFLSEDWVFVIRQNGELWFYSVHGMDKADDWFIVVWATGQTDKNGTELFNGDKLKNDSDSTFEVYWDKQYLQWCVGDDSGDTYPLSEPDSINDMVKIGSKYEDE